MTISRATLPLVRGEVNVADYILLESIRLVFPTLYEDIRSHPATYIGSALDFALGEQAAVRARDRIASVLKVLPDRTRERAERVLIEVFPQLSRVVDSEKPHWSELEHGALRASRRIASEAYLPKYFLYGAPWGEVSDVQTQEFIQWSSSATTDQVFERFQELWTSGVLLSLIDKLAESTIRAPLDQSVLTALARISSKLPTRTDEGFGLFGFAPIARAAWIAWKSIEVGVADEERFDLVREIIEASSDLLFSHQLLRLLIGDQQHGESQILGEDEIEPLGQLLLTKVEAAARTEEFWTDSLRVARLVPTVRSYSDSQHSKEFWSKVLQENPSRALGLLGFYFPSLVDGHTPTNEQVEAAVNAVGLEDLDAACQALVDQESVEGVEPAKRFLDWRQSKWEDDH